MGETRNSHW